MIAKDAVNPSSIDVTFDDIGGKLTCHISSEMKHLYTKYQDRGKIQKGR
jgi:hypothetical protein